MHISRLNWIGVIAVLGGGFVAGLAMSRGDRAADHTASPPKAPTAVADRSTGSSNANPDDPTESGLAAVVHRFPLTQLDVKETMESAAVAVTDDGTVHVAWASRVSPDEWQVFLASSSDRGETFAAPRVVARSAVHRVTSQSRGKTITREVRMMPRLVSHGEELILGWVEAVADNSAVEYRIARSTGGGKSFSSPVVASVTEGARPTYTSLAVAADGRIGASWLDNRNKVQLPAAAISSPDGTFDGDQIIYEPEGGKGVCPCCPTKLILADDGTAYLAFRNQQNGFRDMWISRLPAGSSQFEPPKPVVAPTWKFDGCPHDGPALVVNDDRLSIAWMDARSGQSRVYLAQGDSDVENFSAHEIDAEAKHSQGHPALSADRKGTLHLAWDEGSGPAAGAAATAAENHPSETGAEKSHAHGSEHQATAGETSRQIRYAAFDATGRRLREPAAVAPLAGGFQTRPTVAVHPSGDIYIGWVELSERGKSIAVARLKGAPASSVALQGTGR